MYLITHLQNLGQIVKDGVLWSDSEMLRQNRVCTVVGMSEIKLRRLQEIEVNCHPGYRVGQFVPFYFCPRSVMLYLLHQGNHVNLTYRGGQNPIVHLVADIDTVLRWAAQAPRPWAFSKVNAGARYSRFFNEPAELQDLDWNLIDAHDWKSALVKEAKQAEFLVFESFPWQLIEQIGVIDATKQAAVAAIVSGAAHTPQIEVRRDWYY
jgi:hypothetical protein